MNLNKNNSAIIWGGGSGVGRALANYLASLNYDLLLCARSERDLVALSADIENKYNVKISYCSIDINEELQTDIFFNKYNINNYKEIYITIGKVWEPDNAEQNNKVIDSLIDTNFISPIKLLNRIILQFDKKDRLRILVISSIAVFRARKNNILYSTSKKALDFYCQALQHKYNKSNISISVCRLGYVDTEMAYGKKLLFPAADKMKIAKKMQKLLIKERRLFYLPVFWKIIHFGLKILPWSIYKRLNF